MRKKIGSGITDSNGVASCNYTGKAVGKMNVVAETKTDDRILQSETYEVTDCILYNDFETEYSSIMNYNSGTTVSLSSDWCVGGSKSVKCVTGSDSYFGWGTNSPTDFVGKSVKIEFDINTDKSGSFVYIGSGAILDWGSIQTGTSHFSKTYNISSSETSIRFRWINFSNATVYVDNFECYPI